jgi:hypothetical protein
MKHTAAGVDDPITEIAATAGLLLMFAAVIGVVLGIEALRMGTVVLATVVVGLAVTSFVASLACFMVDGRR